MNLIRSEAWKVLEFLDVRVIIFIYSIATYNILPSLIIIINSSKLIAPLGMSNEERLDSGGS